MGLGVEVELAFKDLLGSTLFCRCPSPTGLLTNYYEFNTNRHTQESMRQLIFSINLGEVLQPAFYSSLSFENDSAKIAYLLHTKAIDVTLTPKSLDLEGINSAIFVGNRPRNHGS